MKSSFGEARRLGLRSAGLLMGNSKSLHMMRFQLVHYSHCYLCNSGSCQYPRGLSARRRKLDISGKAFHGKRGARIEELNHNMSASPRWSLYSGVISVCGRKLCVITTLFSSFSQWPWDTKTVVTYIGSSCRCFGLIVFQGAQIHHGHMRRDAIASDQPHRKSAY